MATAGDIIFPASNIVLDIESVISLLVLVGLLTFFYNAFGRMYEAGGEKAENHRMSYGNSAAV